MCRWVAGHRDCRELEFGRKDDRCARPSDPTDRADATKQMFEFLVGARSHLDQVTILARDAMEFENVGLGSDALDDRIIIGEFTALRKRDESESRVAAIDGVRVHHSGVAGDDSSLFEFANPLVDRRS